MREILRAAALIGALGFSTALTILLSFAFGYWLDRRLGTSFLKFVFLILGIGAGYWGALRQIRTLLR